MSECPKVHFVALRFKHVLQLIYSVAQCSKITNTVLLLKHKSHDFSTFVQFSTSNVKMSEGTFCRVEVHMCLTASTLTC